MANKKKNQRKRDRNCIICLAEAGQRCRNSRDGTPKLRDHRER